MAWKSCPVGRKRWRRKSMIPSDRLKFPPSSSKFARSCGSARFPFGFRQKISVWWNFLPEKRSENAGTDVKEIQKAKTATDVVHVRQGKELSGSPFSCRTPAWNHFSLRLWWRLSCSLCIAYAGCFAHIHVRRYCLPFPWEKRLTATGGVTQTFPDMEEHSGKKSGRRAIIWLYNNKVVFLQKIILWL